MKINVDKGLNPENCEGKGYEWIGDKIYDVSAPNIVNKEVFDFARKGYLIGQAASMATDIYVGVYAPLKTE